MTERRAGRAPAWLRVLRYAVLADLRNPGLRFLAAGGFLAAAAYAWSQGDAAGTSALILNTWLGRAYGVAGCLWFAYAAIRDLDDRLGAALRSKPIDGAHWTLNRWGAGTLVWLLLLGAAFLGAAIGQLPHSGIASLTAHGWGFIRAGLLVTIVVTVSFTLSRMLRSPLGGIITMFAWFCTIAGLQYIPAAMRPEYTQNRVFFVPAALTLLALAALVVERFRRGELRRPIPALLAVVVLGSLSGFGAIRASEATPSYLDDREVVLGPMARQNLVMGERVPGFWLPDGRGGIVSTGAHPGKILLIYLFAADDPEAARSLPALDQIAAEFRERGVQPIGICLSLDQGDGPALARTAGYRFPIGSDPTATKTTPPPDSVMAVAYNADLMPLLVITDRRRRVRNIQTFPSYTVDDLRRMVNEQLQAEPGG